MIISSERNIGKKAIAEEFMRLEVDELNLEQSEPYRFVTLRRSIEENAKLILSWVPWLL